MIDKVSINDCCLCKSCYNACPKDCISFTNEVKTFMYPEINKDICIKCNLCEKACPALNDAMLNAVQPIKAYAAKNVNDSIRMQSSSGGIFSSLAVQVIKNGGIVFGAQYDDDFNVKFTYVDNLEDLPKLYGSKYAQADIANSFNQAKELLDCGRTVLFSGCPCQIGGLNTFLGKKYDNLITMDFICHGILSDVLFKDYRSYLEQKHNSKIVSINFRDKSKGWENNSFKVVFADGNFEIQNGLDNIYMRCFYTNLAMKESCYSCNFRGFKSGSDFTVGDYWGAEIYHKDFIDGKGLSAITINTAKGVDFYNKIKDTIITKETTVENIAKTNKGLYISFEKHHNRNKFFEYAMQKGNAKALKKYCSVKKSDQCIKVLKGIVKKIIGRK